ncbi:hypothetical protein AHAS_Ahas01G0305200 [Arachis hypogaea]
MKHISRLNVTHKLLRELDNYFDLYNNSLDKWYGGIKITPDKIRDVLCNTLPHRVLRLSRKAEMARYYDL